MELLAAFLTTCSMLLLLWHVSRSALIRAREVAGAQVLGVRTPRARFGGMVLGVVCGGACALVMVGMICWFRMLGGMASTVFWMYWLMTVFFFASGILLPTQAGVEIRERGILWCTGMMTWFMPWSRVKQCTWAANRKRLTVQLDVAVRKLPVPANQAEAINAALAPYVEVRDADGKTISTPPARDTGSQPPGFGAVLEAVLPYFRAQFSLKTLLLIVLTASFACGWVELHFRPIRQQRATVAELERFAPTVDWMGGSLYSLDFSKSAVKPRDDDLKQLAGLDTLQQLDLSDCPVTDAGLRHLDQLPKLTFLILSGTQVTDAGLEHLKKMSQLDNIALWGSQVTDEGIEDLKRALPDAEIW